MNQEIDNHFRGLLNSLENFIHSETVVGKPIVVGETTVIPLFRVSLGLGAGSGQKEDSQKDPEINSARKNHRKWKAFGSTKSHTIQTGSGAGATIVPYGVISVTKGETTVLPLARNSFEGIMNLLPKVMSQVNSESKPENKNAGTSENNTNL
jgi:uncharacterized spore protein YtfJ